MSFRAFFLHLSGKFYHLRRIVSPRLLASLMILTGRIIPLTTHLPNGLKAINVT